MQRPAARALALTVAMGLAALGSVAAAGPASADDNNGASGLSAHVFASGGSTLSAPDDITSMGGSIFVAWQNGVGPKGEPAANGNTQSTVVEYSRSGRNLHSWQLTGRVDGMTADAAHDRIIATVNEDGDTSLYTIRAEAPDGSQLVHYSYSPNPPVHGGGTDAPHIYRGQILISASNPSDTTQPAVYRAVLSGTTATLTPVFFDNVSATVANTDSPQNGQQVSLALSDPDSNAVVPGSSPRFGRDFMLDSQGELQQVYVRNAGRANQKFFVLNLTQSVDDTAWATASRGGLYATDGKNHVYAVRGHFHVGTAFSAVTPGNANNAPPNPGPNHLATLNLNTGALTPVPGITFTAKGLVFVAGRADDNSEGD
ncbi:MAG TPA: hypothetical protein VN895_00405 [Candidatus Acidoferrum sp.]|nr:hypothetical protein [Candidatus Acidoferrum sp.]